MRARVNLPVLIVYTTRMLIVEFVLDMHGWLSVPPMPKNAAHLLLESGAAPQEKDDQSHRKHNVGC